MTEYAAGRWSPEVQRSIVSSFSRAEGKIFRFDVGPERDVVPVMKQRLLGRGFMVERQTSCGKYSLCEKFVSQGGAAERCRAG